VVQDVGDGRKGEKGRSGRKGRRRRRKQGPVSCGRQKRRERTDAERRTKEGEELVKKEDKSGRERRGFKEEEESEELR